MPSDRRSSFALADLVAVAAGPVLVMLMVGSLVWFLVDVLYQGQYSGRLLWSLSFFVAGAVLIARITIEHGAARAAVYALALGGAVFLAMLRFVEYPTATAAAVGPVVNLGLMALVWWSANRLTWDCTHLEEDRKASGRGILAAAGLDAPPGTDPDGADDTDKAARRKKKDPDGFAGWLARFERHRAARRKRPHTPGTWVLYFGLAAVPVFALGQSLIPAADSARRWTTLLEMAVFVGSGLGLLVTTTLMGLRRYLEERNASLSPQLTLGWLGLGAMLIAGFLLVGALLPRPHSEVPLYDFGISKSAERDASKYAQVRDGSAGKGGGAKGSATEPGGQTDGKNGSAGGKSGENGSGGGQGKQGQSGDQKGGQGGSGNDGQGQKGNDPQSGKQGQSGDKSDAGQKSEKSQGRQADGSEKQPGNGEKGDDEKGDGRAESSDSPQRPSGLDKLGHAVGAVGSLLKWLAWLLVALAVLAAVTVFVLKYLVPFTDWARGLLDWLRGLVGPKRASGPRAATTADEPAGPERPPPFSAFANPFADGTARRRTPAELAAYTLAAFDAWAWDRDLGRSPGETPAEFAARVAEEYPEVRESARWAADLAVRGLYSRSPMPADTAKALAAFWRQLEQAATAGSV